MESADFVIVGAGLAGAATAWRLTELGVSSVLILEKEQTPGVHSSGRNAAMVRQVVSDPPIAALARQGAAFIRRLPEAWDEKVHFDQRGSLLLASAAALDSLRNDLAEARKAGLEAALRSADQCVRQVPPLEGADFESGLWCPSDGVVDVEALLRGFVREAVKRGARLWTQCEAQGFQTRAGRIEALQTSRGPIRAKTVVNAAGAWAGAIGRMAGAADIRLDPCRRHLFLTGPLAWANPEWPFVWDVVHEVYFRPEPPGLLLSPCDEAVCPPGIPQEDDAAAELLAEKLARHLPRLADVSISRFWAGLRTQAPDRRFVIGWDPRLEGFFWVAGLGGHGVTTSPAVGALAAEQLAGKSPPSSAAFDPGRFAR